MSQRHFSMKWISFAVLTIFFFTSLGINSDAFAAAPLTLQGVGGHAETNEFPSASLEIPAEFGQVSDIVAGDPSAPVFIHIQSAHGNYLAEKNIENILGYIEKKSNSRLLLLEGAAAKLHPELFRMFPRHPDFNRKVTDKLMREGYLTGPENFLINQKSGEREKANANVHRSPFNVSRGEAVQAYGIEDIEAYKKDREAFINVVKKEKTAEKFLGSQRAAIDKRFASKLNKELLNLVRREEAFDSGLVTSDAWLKTLGEGSKKHLKQDLSDAFYQNQYPVLIRYFRLQEIGGNIDHDKALAEADAFIKELAKRGISKEIIDVFRTSLTEKGTGSHLASLPVSSSKGEYSPLRGAFDSVFDKLPKNFSMAQWPKWTLYAQYVILMQEMEGQGLHDEMLRLKDKIQTVLARTPDEKEYLAASRQHYLMRRLFKLELTRDEYEELRAKNEASRNAWPQIAELYDSAMSFYSTAVVRENLMFANALKRMSAEKNDRAVIVTGGFHVEGLKKLAASKRCSYLLITPRITEVSKRDHEVYLRSILGSRDLETSQMSALLGIVGRAQRVAVTGAAATKTWVRDIRALILGMVNSEGVESSDLKLDFSNSIFGSPTLVAAPVRVRSEVRSQKDVAEQIREAEHIYQHRSPREWPVTGGDAAAMQYWRNHGEKEFYDSIDQAVAVGKSKSAIFSATIKKLIASALLALTPLLLSAADSSVGQPVAGTIGSLFGGLSLPVLFMPLIAPLSGVITVIVAVIITRIEGKKDHYQVPFIINSFVLQPIIYTAMFAVCVSQPLSLFQSVLLTVAGFLAGSFLSLLPMFFITSRGVGEQVTAVVIKWHTFWIKHTRAEDDQKRVKKFSHIEALTELGWPAVLPLIKAWNDQDGDTQRQILTALGRIRPVMQDAVEFLTEQTTNADVATRVKAIEILGDIVDDTVDEFVALIILPALRIAANDANESVRSQAVASIGRIRSVPRDVAFTLQGIIEDHEKSVRQAAEKSSAGIQQVETRKDSRSEARSQEDVAEWIREAEHMYKDRPLRERPVTGGDAAAMQYWRNQGEEAFYDGIDEALKMRPLVRSVTLRSEARSQEDVAEWIREAEHAFQTRPSRERPVTGHDAADIAYWRNHGEEEFYNNIDRVLKERSAVQVATMRAETRDEIAAKAEEMSKETDQLNRQIIHRLREGLVVYGADYRCKLWSEEMEKMTEWPASAVLGRYPWEVFPFPKKEGVILRIKEAMVNKTTRTIEFPYTLPSGKSGWIADTISPFLNEQGEVIGAIANIRDITDLKEMVLQNEHVIELLHENQERLIQQGRLAAVGTLIAGVTHELNNPMAIMEGLGEHAVHALAEIKLEEGVRRIKVDEYSWGSFVLAENKLDEVENYLKEIMDHLRRTRKIVKDLLLSVRPKGAAVTKVSFPISRAIQTALDSYAVAINSAQVVMDVKIDPMLIAYGDEDKMVEVVMNLIKNALDAPKGISDKRITVLAEGVSKNDGRKMIRMLVRDNGVGADPRDVHKWFEPYYTTKPRGEGTGLGLPLVKNYVEEIGGSITATTALGKGATFEILIPYATASEIEAESIAAKSTAAAIIPVEVRSIRKVLVIDDQEIIGKLYKLALAAYEVVYAKNGEEALKLFDQQANKDKPFDLIITDYSMPVMNGVVFARAFRELEHKGLLKKEKTPVLLMTGFDVGHEYEEALELQKLGVLDWIEPKTMKSKQLQTLVEEMKRLPLASVDEKMFAAKKEAPVDDLKYGDESMVRHTINNSLIGIFGTAEMFGESDGVDIINRILELSNQLEALNHVSVMPGEAIKKHEEMLKLVGEIGDRWKSLAKIPLTEEQKESLEFIAGVQTKLTDTLQTFLAGARQRQAEVRSESRQIGTEDFEAVLLKVLDRIQDEITQAYEQPEVLSQLRRLDEVFSKRFDSIDSGAAVPPKNADVFWAIPKGIQFGDWLEAKRRYDQAAQELGFLARSEVRGPVSPELSKKIAERWKKIRYMETDPQGAAARAKADKEGEAFLANAQEQIRKVAKQIRLDPKILEKLLRFEKIIHVKIPLTLDEGGEPQYVDGWRIGHNGARGPYKGGIRFAIEVMEATIKALATEMSVKNAIAGLPYGGGKGGVAINPKELSVKELARLTRGYVAECLKQDPKAFGALLDVPAGDIGTTSREMGWFADEFLKITQPDLFTAQEFKDKLAKTDEVSTPFLEYYMKEYYGKRHIDMSEGSPIATVTAKPEGKGGAVGRTPATGLGLYFVTREALKVYGERLKIGTSVKGQRVAVEAYGNVGSYAARSFRKDGASIMAIKEFVNGRSVAVAAVTDKGIDLDALDKHLNVKNADGTSKGNSVLTYTQAHPEDARETTIDEFWSSSVTIMALAAKQKTVDQRIAKLIQAKIVSEGANGPLEDTATEKILLDKGAIVLCDVFTNDGGVAFSSLEWRQNNIGELWPEVAGNGLMEDKVVSAFYDISRVSESQKISLREAAYQIAISRIVDAMLAADRELSASFDEAHPAYVMDAGAKRWRPETLPELNQLDSRAKRIQLIEKADQVMNKKIEEIVAQAVRELPAKRGSVIFIGGPRASGKPMLGVNILKKLRAQGVNADLLDMDFQTPEDVSRVLQGKRIFTRLENGTNGEIFQLSDNEILIVNGYYALGDEILRMVKAMKGKAFPIMAYSSPDILLANNWAMTAYDLRLMRDILSSIAVGEEANVQEVIRRWQWQRVSESEAVFATWKNAERAINTYLPYEPPFLKSLVGPMIRVAIQQETARPGDDGFTLNVLRHLDSLLKDIEGWDVALLEGHHDSVLWEYVQRYAPDSATDIPSAVRQAYLGSLIAQLPSAQNPENTEIFERVRGLIKSNEIRVAITTIDAALYQGKVRGPIGNSKDVETLRTFRETLDQRLTAHTARAEVRESESNKWFRGMPEVMSASSLGAKIETAIRVAANTVSPLLSSSPVYASEIEPVLFAGTAHYQKELVVPAIFEEEWPAFNKILGRFATASTERMVIDQRHKIPDAASLLPLITFAFYNPKVGVTLALIADVPDVDAFAKKLAALSPSGALPENFKVQPYSNENEFVAAFAGLYNDAIPYGKSIALVTDREDSVVTQKIGSHPHLLSVVGGQNPLKQTASALLAADKLLNESIWSLGYHFVSVERLGGLESLMAELTSFVATQAKVLASA